jgi:hypothetical protein
VSFSTYTIHQLLILKTGEKAENRGRSEKDRQRHTKKTHKEKDNKKKKSRERIQEAK